MTRYARASGSKACNSKRASASTPWHILKKNSLQSTDGEYGSQNGSQIRNAEFEQIDKKKSETVACNGSWFDFCENTSSKTCRKELKNKVIRVERKIAKPKVKLSKNSGIQRTDELSDKYDHGKSVIHAAVKSSELISNEKSSPEVSEKKKLIISSDQLFKNPTDQPSVGNGMVGRVKRRIEDLDHLREIRRAEKALQREKKKLCFCCRRWGHQLSDCPEFHPETTMEMSIPAGGFCYRCGSTEHKLNQCSKSRNSSLQYARCFVCGGSGHLARDCSDNPNGKYPKGGSCLNCGSKNHLRVDCPTSTDNESEADSGISSLSEGPVDVISEDLKRCSSKMDSPSQKKIKF